MKDFVFEETFGFQLSKTWSLLKTQLQRSIQKEYPGLTLDYWNVLYHLWKQDGINQTELARLTMKDNASITRILDGMAAKGLIERRQDQADRRAYLVCLTGQGKMLQLPMTKLLSESMSAGLKGLGADQIGTLISILKDIQRNL